MRRGREGGREGGGGGREGEEGEGGKEERGGGRGGRENVGRRYHLPRGPNFSLISLIEGKSQTKKKSSKTP